MCRTGAAHPRQSLGRPWWRKTRSGAAEPAQHASPTIEVCWITTGMFIGVIPSSTMRCIKRGCMRSMATSNSMRSGASVAQRQYGFRYLTRGLSDPDKGTSYPRTDSRSDVGRDR